MYKLVGIDIDGTLLNDQREVTKEVKEAIQAAKWKGVKIVLTTGRPIGGVNGLVEELKLNDQDDFVITYNGALVQNTYTNEVISQISLTFQDLKDLYELSKNLHSPMHFFDTEHIYTPNKNINKYTVYESYVNQVPLLYRTIDEISENILIPKIMFIDDPEKLNRTIENIPNSYKEKYMMVKSAPFFFEILHPEVSKGNAIKKLAEKLSIQQEEIICIGDGGNDLSMIEYAGCGVAMGNAEKEVKEAAQFHTLSNNDHGVAYAIHKLILNG